MTNQDQSDKIAKVLMEVQTTHAFRRCWELYKHAFDISEIQGFYLKTERAKNYCNIAIVGDGKLVDIEGDDDELSGHLSLRYLNSISGVAFNWGALQSVSRTQGASLVVVTRLAGETSPGPYWAATTPEEEEQLVAFVKCLVEQIPH